MDDMKEVQAAVLKDLIDTIDDHSGGRVRNESGLIRLPKAERKQQEEVAEDDPFDMDPRLKNLLRDK